MAIKQPPVVDPTTALPEVLLSYECLLDTLGRVTTLADTLIERMTHGEAMSPLALASCADQLRSIEAHRRQLVVLLTNWWQVLAVPGVH